MQTKVKNVMTNHPVMIDPETTLKEAAQKMEELDCGILPVGTKDEQEGIITDRDIVIRAVSRGKDVNTEKVKDYMTADVCCCSADDTIEQAADIMRVQNINRLLVKDEGDQICGIITFGTIVRKTPDTKEKSNAVEHAVKNKAA